MSTTPYISEQTAGRSVGTRVLCWSLVLCVLAGCTTLKDVPTTHIVMINGRGNPVDPTGNFGAGRHVWGVEYSEIERAPYSIYLDNLLKELIEKAPKKGNKRQVLIFVHGGLNTQVGTVERAAALQDAIFKEDYYPIFINWQSSLLFSYRDHLLNIRQGEPRGWGWTLLAPFYLGTDLARGIARAPILWSFGVWNHVKGWKFLRAPSEDEADDIADELVVESTQPKTLKIAYDDNDSQSTPDFLLSTSTYVLTTPLKMVITPFLDAFGKSAWDNMLRRTQMLYHTDREFLESDQVANDQTGNTGRRSHIAADGALSVFLHRLQKTINASQDGREGWEITLVGHSMGTIVINEMIRNAGDLPIRNIVYMAAAVTVREYASNLFPYLLTKNKTAEVYHLMLHPAAESRERFDVLIPYLDPPPRGSLLVWIDDFLSNPETPLDRTLGRFENFMVALHDTPEEVRSRIHVTVFGAGSKARGPQEHGDFTQKFKFWKESCWWSAGPGPALDCYCP